MRGGEGERITSKIKKWRATSDNFNGRWFHPDHKVPIKTGSLQSESTAGLSLHQQLFCAILFHVCFSSRSVSTRACWASVQGNQPISTFVAVVVLALSLVVVVAAVTVVAEVEAPAAVAFVPAIHQ